MKIIRKQTIFIALVLASCTQSPTGLQDPPQDTAITLATNISSEIAEITRTPDKKQYNEGDTVILTATAKSGYTFTGWTGDVTATTDSLLIVMTTSKTVYANFENNDGDPLYSIATSSPHGSITLSPDDGVYKSGTTVYAYARPDYGFQFTGWTGDITETNKLASIIVTENTSLTAHFNVDPEATFSELNISPTPHHGTLQLDPPGFISGTTHKYEPGTSVTVTAIPDPGYELVSWDADFSTVPATDLSFTSNIESDQIISASFKKSPEGRHWTNRVSGTIAGLCSVIWTNNQLVVVGNSGTILTSPDAKTWSSHATEVTSCLNCVIWTGDLYVCVGDNGTILTSSHGNNWDKRESGTTYNLQSVVWTGTQFIAVGGYIRDSGTNYNCILKSKDGITWTDHSSGSGIWYCIATNGSKLVAAGYDFNYTTVSDYSTSFIKYSSNGTKWNYCSSSIPLEASFISIIWTGSEFVAVGGSRSSDAFSSVYRSQDGDIWTKGMLPTRSFIRSVTWTGNTLVAVGDDGQILYSMDGLTWKEAESETTDPLYAITWTGTQLVAVGYGGLILTSP